MKTLSIQVRTIQTLKLTLWLTQMSSGELEMKSKKDGLGKKKRKPVKTPYNGRDYNIIKIIGGATKSYVEQDQKKEENKRRSRKKVDVNNE